MKEKFNPDNFEVGMAKLACPMCFNYSEDVIVMPNEITEKAYNAVSEANHQIIGLMDHLCPTCDGHVADGKCCLIAIDEDKTEPDEEGKITLMNAYRTGRYAFADLKATEKTFGITLDKTVYPVIFLSDEVFDMIESNLKEKQNGKEEEVQE